jgi:O-antigen/teichoic acid export membrane protein
LCNSLLYQGFFAFVGFALSPEAAGLLKAADTFIAPFAQVVIGMQMMLMPMTARNADTMSGTAQRKLALRISLVFLALSVAYSAIIYLAGEWALILVFGEAMREAVPLLAILAFLPLVRGLPMGAQIILSARKRADLRFISQVSASVLTVVACVPLIYHTGLTGAAVGMVLPQVIYAGGLWTSLLWLWRQDRAPAASPAL